MPNFIKIDVDGLEHKVIAGAVNTLKDSRVKSVLVELSTKLQEHVNVIDLLVSFGFEYDIDQAENDRSK